jgi:hypothetical protein
VLAFKRHGPQRDAGATLDLYCPRCRLSITPRARWLALEHCPRCVARTRTLVTLLPSDAPLPASNVVLPRSPERADRKLLKATQDARRRTWQRRRGKATRDRGSRRLSRAVDAQRRLNAPPADTQEAEPFGPSDQLRIPDAAARLRRSAGAAFKRTKERRCPELRF